MTTVVRLSPRLVVEGADQALRYYTKALGATEIKRFSDDSGKIVHSALALGDYVIMVKDADESDTAPSGSGGSVILTLEVDDVDAVGQRMVDGGATVVFPIADQEYGQRSGRLRDPYGHLWILSQPLADPGP